MTRKPVTGRCCPNVEYVFHGEKTTGNVIRHSFYNRKDGRRRHYRCTACGRTFSANTGTIYERLHCSRDEFDRVAQLSVEGMSKSAVARVTRRAWNTIARWLALASDAARKFNDHMARGFELKEQSVSTSCARSADPRRSHMIFTTLEVWSRLWVATVVGRRSYANTYKVLVETARRGRILALVLITTDGFKHYRLVVRRVFAQACVHGQVVKTWCKNRVRTVKTKLAMGSQAQIQRALQESEDSIKLNTAFSERSNLTVRQGSAYLSRRSPCHPRVAECLDDSLELLR